MDRNRPVAEQNSFWQCDQPLCPEQGPTMLVGNHLFEQVGFISSVPLSFVQLFFEEDPYVLQVHVS